MVDRYDPDDHRRDLQFRCIRLCGCDLGHTTRSVVSGDHDDSVCNLLERATQLRGQGWVLLLHHWSSGHRHECTAAIICQRYPGDAKFRRHPRFPYLCRSDPCRVALYRSLGGPSLWQEEHVRLSQHLQHGGWIECGRDSGFGFCGPRSD